MARFDEVLNALVDGKKFRHENFYDGQWIEWANNDKHLMLSKKFLLSESWEIQPDESPQESLNDDAGPKKKSKK